MAKISSCIKSFRRSGQKTGQLLVRTLRDPRDPESSVISGKKVGYVRSCEFRCAALTNRVGHRLDSYA